MRTAAFFVAVLVAPVLAAGCAPSAAKGRASLLAADRAIAEATDARGKYVTIWRRAPSGDWKMVLDIGNGVRD